MHDRRRRHFFFLVCFSLSLSKTVSRLSFVGGSVPLLSLSLCGVLRRMQSSFLSGPFFSPKRDGFFHHIKSRVFSALLSWTIHTHIYIYHRIAPRRVVHHESIDERFFTTRDDTTTTTLLFFTLVCVCPKHESYMGRSTTPWNETTSSSSSVPPRTQTLEEFANALCEKRREQQQQQQQRARPLAVEVCIGIDVVFPLIPKTLFVRSFVCL